jgi:uncharacterized protein YjiS (DUF1127 family)
VQRNTRVASKGDFVVTALTSIFRSLVGSFQAWRERERTYSELNSLDDHTLADLGLRRSDIPLVVFSKGREFEANVAASQTRSAANSNNGLRAA